MTVKGEPDVSGISIPDMDIDPLGLEKAARYGMERLAKARPISERILSATESDDDKQRLYLQMQHYVREAGMVARVLDMVAPLPDGSPWYGYLDAAVANAPVNGEA